MGDEVRIWRVRGDELSRVAPGSLDLEARLQGWLANDISVLDPEFLVIGKEVPSDFAGAIDLLCIDRRGDLVVVELKRDRTPREVTAQALDYASWVVGLSNERVSAQACEYLGRPLEEAFRETFGEELPETLNLDSPMG